jgi:hypothetical protein
LKAKAQSIFFEVFRENSCCGFCCFPWYRLRPWGSSFMGKRRKPSPGSVFPDVDFRNTPETEPDFRNCRAMEKGPSEDGQITGIIYAMGDLANGFRFWGLKRFGPCIWANRICWMRKTAAGTARSIRSVTHLFPDTRISGICGYSAGGQ